VQVRLADIGEVGKGTDAEPGRRVAGLAAFGGGDGDTGDGIAAGALARIRVAADVADETDLVV